MVEGAGRGNRAGPGPRWHSVGWPLQERREPPAPLAERSASEPVEPHRYRKSQSLIDAILIQEPAERRRDVRSVRGQPVEPLHLVRADKLRFGRFGKVE